MKPENRACKIVVLEKAESTNTELRRLKNELDNLSVVAALEQTKGRGQGNHSWYSSPGTNLTFSILYRYSGLFEMKAGEALLITQITTLAIRDYLRTKGVEARIKWPNDIWVGQKKICGILIENSLNGSLVCDSIVGIGLNLNEENWPSELPNPVSLKELTGKNYDMLEELSILRDMIARRFSYLNEENGIQELEEEFNLYMFRLP